MTGNMVAPGPPGYAPREVRPTEKSPCPRQNPTIGVNKIQAVLKARTGSGGKADWVSNEKKRVLNGGTGGAVLRAG
jgi:hypothetical protein